MHTLKQEDRIWWARWWFRHLKRNEHYNAYCVAVTAKDTTVINQLEKQYIFIKQIFNDWGDIYQVNHKDTKNKVFRKWYEQHKHLFEEVDRDIHVISTANDITSNTLNIALPIYWNKTRTLRQVRDYVEHAYKKQIDTIHRDNPPYNLARTNGRLSNQLKQAVEKSSNAYKASLMVHSDGTKLTAAEQVLKICEREEDGISNTNIWGWHLTKNDLIEIKMAKDLFDTTTALNTILEDKIRALRRYRKMNKEIVENTLQYNTFPKYTNT